MVETKTIICDICKEKVAKDKCSLCKKDLCNNCIKRTYLSLRGIYADGSGTFGDKIIPFCINCSEKLIKNTPSDNPLLDGDFLNKLSDEVVEYITKKLIINELEKDGEKV